MNRKMHMIQMPSSQVYTRMTEKEKHPYEHAFSIQVMQVSAKFKSL